MVQKDTGVSRSRFRASQKRVAKTVRQAKEQWIERLSKAADDSDRDSKWPCIEKLQLLHSGREPVRIPTIVEEQGNLLSQSDDIRGRWLRHFIDVLNVESKFERSVFNTVPTWYRQHLGSQTSSSRCHLASAGRQLARTTPPSRLRFPAKIFALGKDPLAAPP